MLNKTTKLGPGQGSAYGLHCGVLTIAILTIAVSCVKRPRAASGGGDDTPTCAAGQTLVDGVCQTAEQPGTVIEDDSAQNNDKNQTTLEAGEAAEAGNTGTATGADTPEQGATTDATDQTTEEPTSGADAHNTKGGESAKAPCTEAQTAAYNKCLLSSADAATCQQQAGCAVANASP